MRVATLSEMLEEVVRLGEATGMEGHAHELRGELEGRLATIRAAVSGAGSPRVIAFERLDPPRVGGFWIPEMISIAGGIDVAGDPGLNPPEVGWGELESLNADVAIVILDGSVEDAQAQAMEHWERIAALGADRVFAVDAAAAFVDPGPRLVDGVELLGHLLHPERIDPPGNIAFMALKAPVPRSSPGGLTPSRRPRGAPNERDARRPRSSRRTRRSAVPFPACPRSPATTARAQMTPPIESAEVAADADVAAPMKLKIRLKTIRNPSSPSDRVHAATAGDHEDGAEEAEDRSGSADGERVRLESRAPNEPASSEAK